jgi:hypothetical protein
MLRILSVLFIVTNFALAHEVKITHLKSGRLLLSANNCEVLYREREFLCEWKEKVHQSQLTSSQNQCYFKRQAYNLIIDKCLPKLARDYSNKPNFKHGPNCWGTAMSLHGLSTSPRFIWPQEMHYWQNSSICRKLDLHEEKIPGDIINTYGPEYINSIETTKDPGHLFWELINPERINTTHRDKIGYTGYHWLLHSEIFISQQLSFGKESPNKLDRYLFRKLDEVYGRPRAQNKECQEAQHLSPHLREFANKPRSIKGKKCDYFSLAFRCKNFQVFTRNASESLKKDLEKLNRINDQIFQQSMSTSPLISNESKRKWSVFAKSMVQKTSMLLSQQHLNEVDQLITTNIYFTANAILKDLNN